MSQHALLAPSGFKALMLCPAKPAMERGLPDDASEYADEGTAAHFLASWCLTRGEQAPMYLGRKIVVWVHPESCSEGAAWGGDTGVEVEIRSEFGVDDEMAEAVQTYIDTVRARVSMYQQLGAQVELFIEQSVPIGHITGEEGAEGTADVVIVAAFPDGQVLVENIDLKYGRGVEVSAIDNPQLRLYCLGAIEKFGMVYDFTKASMLICQPRVSDTPSEEAMSVADLQAWGGAVATPAANKAMWLYEAEAVDTSMCNPHEDACRFCKARGRCPALDGFVKQTMGAEFTDLTTENEPEREAIVKTSVATAKAAGHLGAKLAAAPLVEIWLKGIRAEGERELLAGRPVEGFKLVAGKKGARQWADDQAAENLLRKTFRLKVEDAYDLKLISPTKAEKLLKTTPKRWKKAQTLITQNDGKPSVAPVSDPRPALEMKPIESEFTPITEETPATADDLV